MGFSTSILRPLGAMGAALSALCIATAPIAASAAGVGLPVYPGAKSNARANRVFTHVMCNRTIAVESYTTTSQPRAVAQWYVAHIPGGAFVDIDKIMGPSETGGLGKMIQLEVISPDGSSAAVVNRMQVSNAKMAAMLGMDKTDIGLERFEPALGADMVRWFTQATRSPAALAAAKARFRAQCPDAHE